MNIVFFEDPKSRCFDQFFESHFPERKSKQASNDEQDRRFCGQN